MSERKAYRQIEVSALPDCQFCGKPALYDAKTGMGCWAYMCQRCYGVKRMFASLGLGKGQQLVLAEPKTQGCGFCHETFDLTEQP